MTPLNIRLQPNDPLQLTHPDGADPNAPPPALMSYQQDWIADEAQLKVCEKSRRTGFTWAEAADDVLTAARENGSNVFYISATEDMAREYIEAVAMWARAFDYAASEIGTGIYDDGADVDPEKRYIKKFEVSFPVAGRRVLALSSRPTNLRGKQGVIVIDEAAFHGDLKKLLKAAMAMLLWGDKVRIISTHDGAENPFNELIQEIRAGKRGEASVHRVTFDDAVRAGLYRRVCLRKGIDWTPEGEAAWVAAARGFYGDDAAEELDVIPSQSAGTYLSLALIEQRMTNTPAPDGPAIVRGKWDDSFAFQTTEEVRRYAVDGWLREQVEPVLKGLNPSRRHTFGVDFARSRNLSIITITEDDIDLTHRVRAVIELFNCPFTAQEQIMYFIVPLLPRWRGGAMDAGGNGASLAEKVAQRFGAAMVEQVKLSVQFYLTHMPRFKAQFEDGKLTDIPRDVQLRDDLRAIKVIGGVPKIADGDSSTSAGARAAASEAGEKLKRHGDFAISLFLADYAFTREAGEIDWTPAPTSASRWDGPPDDRAGPRGPDRDAADDLADLAEMSRKGGW